MKLVLCAALFVAGIQAHAPRHFTYILIKPEHRSYLRTGQIGRIQCRRGKPRYKIVVSGDSIRILKKRESGNYVVYYVQAVRAGRAVILLTPQYHHRHCISCQTIHYFITVIAEPRIKHNRRSNAAPTTNSYQILSGGG
jgi:hypothetical protein